ncbi:hypothetical protein D9M68_759700 [compost metagenome]
MRSDAVFRLRRWRRWRWRRRCFPAVPGTRTGTSPRTRTGSRTRYDTAQCRGFRSHGQRQRPSQYRDFGHVEQSLAGIDRDGQQCAHHALGRCRAGFAELRRGEPQGFVRAGESAGPAGPLHRDGRDRPEGPGGQQLGRREVLVVSNGRWHLGGPTPARASDGRRRPCRHSPGWPGKYGGRLGEPAGRQRFRDPYSGAKCWRWLGQCQ